MQVLERMCVWKEMTVVLYTSRESLLREFYGRFQGVAIPYWHPKDKKVFYKG